MYVKQWQETREYSDKYAQNYDRKKIELTKAGVTYNVYDAIQAAREDTEIYPTLEKYGNLKVLERPASEIAGEYRQNLDIRDLFDQENKLKELFESLPLDERRQFNMNFYEFKQNGLEFYSQKAEKEIKVNKKIREENANKAINVKITADETKKTEAK